MLKRYTEFLNEFDKKLVKYFNQHQSFLCCKKGCSNCCEIGDYPFSRLEAEYIMKGFTTLPASLQIQIKQNINDLKNIPKKQMYRCPFLIGKECALYEYRGLICRTFGLCYVDNEIVKLPECANFGLNYSKIYDINKKEIILDNPIKENLRTDMIFKSKLAQKYNLECGEIRPIIEWFRK